MDFKLIEFLIKWILNELNWSKYESNQENYIFSPTRISFEF